MNRSIERTIIMLLLVCMLMAWMVMSMMILLAYDYMAYPLNNSNSGGRTQTVRRKCDAKRSPNMYCIIPQKIVGQKHVEKCLKTYHFGHLSGQSYRSVQSKENANRWAENQTWPWPRPSGNQNLRPFVRNAADNAYRSSEIQHRERENGDRSSEMHRKSASGTRE